MRKMIEKNTFRNRIKRVARAAAFTSAVTLASCAPVAPLLAMHPPNYPVNFSEGELNLKGHTEESFIELLKKKEATNIVRSRGYNNGKLISAITADYLDYIYLFKDDNFFKKFRIKYDGEIPEHIFAVPKIVHYKDSFGIFLLAKDLKVDKKPVAQIVLTEETGKVAHINVPIQEQVERHGDILNPYVGGEDLETGVYFTARMPSWEVWTSAYKITIIDSKVKVEKVLVGELNGCSCFGDWKAGKDVFSINVD